MRRHGRKWREKGTVRPMGCAMTPLPLPALLRPSHLAVHIIKVVVVAWAVARPGRGRLWATDAAGHLLCVIRQRKDGRLRQARVKERHAVVFARREGQVAAGRPLIAVGAVPKEKGRAEP